MDQITIQVRKNKKGDLLDGPFFIKQLNVDELLELMSKIEKAEDDNGLFVQRTLVTKDGKTVFAPQQVSLIKDRIGGVDYLKVLMAAQALNPIQELADLQEKYSKNSNSDQSSDSDT